MSDVGVSRFAEDAKRIIDAHATDPLWTDGQVMVLRGLGIGATHKFIGRDPDALWSFISEAAVAGMCQPIGVDDDEGLFLVVAPRHPTVPGAFWCRLARGGWWEEVDAHTVPVMMYSTASAIREYLLTGERAPMKEANDPRLYGGVHDEPPPTDAEGRL